jgi:hypothetical protein
MGIEEGSMASTRYHCSEGESSFEFLVLYPFRCNEVTNPGLDSFSIYSFVETTLTTSFEFPISEDLNMVNLALESGPF